MTSTNQRDPELGSVSGYLRQIKAVPMLGPGEEFELARRFREDGDKAAGATLARAHLRLVAKIAMSYRGYGMPVSDLISEGSIGLLQAIERYEPEKGFKLSTYASWWIRAQITDFILRNWSLVKIGTNQSQKKMFFHLGKARERIMRLDPHGDHDGQLAERFKVSRREVSAMGLRLSGDASLNAPLASGEDGESEHMDLLADPGGSFEDALGDRQEHQRYMTRVTDAMTKMGGREREVFVARRLSDPVVTLEDLAVRFGVSRERIRQIEVSAFEKVAKAVSGQVPSRVKRGKSASVKTGSEEVCTEFA